MNIDIHAHIIVPEITRDTAPEQAWRPNVVWENGRQFVEFGGRRLSSALREFVKIEAILAEQDEAGVDVLLLTPWSSLFRYDAILDESIEANRIQNDALGRLVASHATRVRALGTVPLQDSQAAIAELKRSMLELGLAGVEIGTNVNGVYLGDPQFRPFWAAAEQLGALVQIHPVRGIGGAIGREYYLWNAYANPAETALTAAHMILSGLLEEHPNLKICLLHGGGHLPYQIGRLDRAYQMRSEARQRISAPPSTYLKKFYFDTITHSAQALSYLVNLVGVSQVMLGSDYPFDMGYERPAEIVHQLPGLDQADRQAILGGNAQRLLG
ncbi:MAG TPA: amidohydrolase family protein [Anaerolineales bacterium]|nr:amidohydrolase family protein [Anaerolineales bacterium]